MGRRGGWKGTCGWGGSTCGGSVRGRPGAAETLWRKEAGETRGCGDTRGGRTAWRDTWRGHYRAVGEGRRGDTRVWPRLGGSRHMLRVPGRFWGAAWGFGVLAALEGWDSWGSGWQPRLPPASPAPPVHPPRSPVSVSWSPVAGRWGRVPPPGGVWPGQAGPALLPNPCEPGPGRPAPRPAGGAELQLHRPFRRLGFGLSSVSSIYKHRTKVVLPGAALVKADSSPLEAPALVCRAQLCFSGQPHIGESSCNK